MPANYGGGDGEAVASCLIKAQQRTLQLAYSRSFILH